MPNEIHSYSELQRQIHDDLRVQHPEWVQPNGDCPTCDSYESRLAELLGRTQRTNSVPTPALSFLGYADDYSDEDGARPSECRMGKRSALRSRRSAEANLEVALKGVYL